MAQGAAGDVDLLRAVRRSLLLGSLSHETLVATLGAARSARVRRGELIARSADDAVQLVLRGAAIASVHGRDGTALTTRLIGPGDVCGLGVVAGSPGTGMEVASLADGEMATFRGAELRRLIVERADLAAACARTLATELAEVRQEQAAFVGSSTLERVVRRLIDLVERWGEPTPTGVHVAVPITQEQLASWAWSSLESTAKALHELRTAGLIWTGRRELVIVDVDGLRSRSRALADRDVTIERLRANV